MAYKAAKKLGGDDAKSNACLKARGFDFAYAIRVFLDLQRIVEQDSRRDYGEDRFQVLGIIEGRLYAVVSTMRNSATRIISARKASAKEVENYEHDTNQGDPDNPASFPKGRLDPVLVDDTTEAQIAQQQREDEEDAMQDMARYARSIRRRLGLTQIEMARRIDVPQETIRNWEQGKRCPTGAARALLRILDKAPETALRVLV